jgi:cytochrome c oxidase cbb3-type subunit 4
MDLVTFHSWWTVVMFATFVGIIVWAWSGKRRRAFEEAARLPLEDDDAAAEQPKAEKNHG